MGFSTVRDELPRCNLLCAYLAVSDAVMLQQVSWRLWSPAFGKVVLCRDISGFLRFGQCNSDHFVSQIIPQPDARVEPAQDDICQLFINGKVQFNIRICGIECSNPRGDGQLPGAVGQRDPQLAGFSA